MQIGKAAPLIYTRTKYVGFRRGFVVQPQDFTEAVAEKFAGYVHDALDNIVELRSLHRYSQIVIAEDGYVVLGVSAFLRDLNEAGWEGRDKGSRPGYGFFGFVWHKEDFPGGFSFPDIREFYGLLEEWIRPHWEDSPNSRWAGETQPGGYEAALAADPAAGGRFTPPAGCTIVGGADTGDKLLQWALDRAAAGGETAVCTNVTVYAEGSYRTRFRHVTSLKRTQPPAQTAPVEQKPENRGGGSARMTGETARTDTGRYLLPDAKGGGKRPGGGLFLFLFAAGLSGISLAVVCFLHRSWEIPGILAAGLLLLGLGVMGAAFLVRMMGKAIVDEKPAEGRRQPEGNGQSASGGTRKPRGRETQEDAFRL